MPTVCEGGEVICVDTYAGFVRSSLDTDLGPKVPQTGWPLPLRLATELVIIACVSWRMIWHYMHDVHGRALALKAL